RAGLAGAEEFAGAAKFEVELGDVEPVLCSHHLVETALSFGCDVSGGVGHEHAVGFRGTAADASAELVELREAEALSVFYDHDVSVGHVYADLDDCGGDQHVNLFRL